MREALIALNSLVADGIISIYAIGGAIGASYYIEATATEDIDVFVFLSPQEGTCLISLEPIYEALKQKGGIVIREYIKFGQWPVQILPAYKPLVEEALRESQAVEYSGIPTRVLKPEYLCAIALDTGRTKDYYRVAMFIEQNAVDMNLLYDLVARYELTDKIKYVSNWK